MPCPFHGFRADTELLVLSSTRGNQCALRVESFAPCQMEDDGEEADWAACTHFNDQAHSGTVRAMREDYRVMFLDGRMSVPFEAWFLARGGGDAVAV